MLTTLRDKIKELDQDKWVMWRGLTLHAILCVCRCSGLLGSLSYMDSLSFFLGKLFCERCTAQPCVSCCSWMFEAPRYTWR